MKAPKDWFERAGGVRPKSTGDTLISSTVPRVGGEEAINDTVPLQTIIDKTGEAIPTSEKEGVRKEMKDELDSVIATIKKMVITLIMRIHITHWKSFKM